VGALPPVFIEFLGKATGFHATVKGVKAELKEVEAQGGGNMAKLGAVGKGALMGIGAAAAYGTYEVVKMAANYQQSLTLISNLAHVSKSDVKSLGSGVLDLAGQVGFSPDSLAEAAYHVESSFASMGISSKTALEMVKIAAEGAAVGQANLVDVQNALDAAIASGIPGVQNMSQGMGALLAIVGSGDMTMQDLADALGTGVLAVVKQYGLTLTDAGAALAVFGDNNIRGAQAATDLKMTVQGFSQPAAGAKKIFDDWGWSLDHLQKDMQKGGLKLALNDLNDQFNKMGVTAAQRGPMLLDMFGKKSGNGISILMAQMDRVNSKYPELAKGANGFADAWKAQSQTFNQQMKNLQMGVEALGIKIGTALLPYAQKLLGWLQQGIGWLTHHKVAVQALAAAIGSMLVVGLVAATVAVGEFTVALLTNPATWVVVGIMAIVAGLVLLVTHWKQVWGWISSNFPAVASAFRAVWTGTMAAFHLVWKIAMDAVHAVVQWFDNNVLKWLQARGQDFSKWWAQNGQELTTVWGVVWDQIKGIAKVVWDILQVGFDVLWGVIKAAWDLIIGVITGAWAIIKSAVTFGIHFVLNIIAVILDVLTGKWGKAWSDLVHFVGQTFADLWHFLGTVVGTVGQILWNVGKDIIMGIWNGLKDSFHFITDGLKSMLGGALKDVKSFLGINSPSKVFRDQVGVSIPEGIAVGIDHGSHHVSSAMRRLHRHLHKHSKSSGKGLATQMQNLGIYAVVSLVQGLTGSEAKITTAVNHVRTALLKMHKGVATRLERYVTKEGVLLERLAKQRDDYGKRIKAAQANLASLEAAWTKERDSVAQGIMGNASIVTGSVNGIAPGAGDVLASMYGKVQKAEQFARDLQRLRAMGLSSDLINQIAQAGADQGGDTATALANGSAAQIAQLNNMQKQMQAAADKTGGAVADSMYGAGIQSAQGLVKGLESQQASIEKLMLKIALSMQNALKHALGIRSPSRVMHELGQWISTGLANGIEASGHKPVEALKRISGALSGAVSQPTMGTSSGSGGVVVYETNVNVTVQGTVRSDRDLRDMLREEMLRLGSRNSGTWVPYQRK
jgi:TP901 family phage tail tape measure protein